MALINKQRKTHERCGEKVPAHKVWAHSILARIITIDHESIGVLVHALVSCRENSKLRQSEALSAPVWNLEAAFTAS